MSIRTKTAALKEATRRWGRNAAVDHRPRSSYANKYLVGIVVIGLFFEVRGQGDSWDAAFADADRARADERERQAARAKVV